MEFTQNYQGFVDHHTVPPRQFKKTDDIRMVPGGSAVRRGAHIARGVIIMPPAYINIGAYVDQDTMVDSNVLVGSCAQIGKRVHLSAGVQIGGVLEPIGTCPTIIEDHVFVGAGSTIVEGIIIRQHAVIAPGVTLSKSTPIYDCVNESKLKQGSAIPEKAVVIKGCRPLHGKWAKANGLQSACALIIKYRDKKTDHAVILEEILR